MAICTTHSWINQYRQSHKICVNPWLEFFNYTLRARDCYIFWYIFDNHFENLVLPGAFKANDWGERVQWSVPRPSIFSCWDTKLIIFWFVTCPKWRAAACPYKLPLSTEIPLYSEPVTWIQNVVDIFMQAVEKCTTNVRGMKSEVGIIFLATKHAFITKRCTFGGKSLEK